MAIYQNSLKHHGVMGMKWGIRRYQPYPKGHNGDGKFVGSKAKKKQLSKKTSKEASTIDYTKTSKAAVGAVGAGALIAAGSSLVSSAALSTVLMATAATAVVGLPAVFIGSAFVSAFKYGTIPLDSKTSSSHRRNYETVRRVQRMNTMHQRMFN